MPELAPLTPRQRQVLAFVQTRIRQHGFSPTFEEIAAHLKVRSLATVHEHVGILVAKGYVRRRFGSRALELVARDGRCPHCGSKLSQQAVTA